MNIHEYQAKHIFDKYDIKVPNNRVARSVEEAVKLYNELGLPEVVVKAQVHAGGRGKAGGVKIVKSEAELKSYAEAMLFSKLVTYQTSQDGQPVRSLLLEEVSTIERELYLGAVVDRAQQRLVIMASSEGGVDIEEVAATKPELIAKVAVDPVLGVMPYQLRILSKALDLNKQQFKQFAHIVSQMAKMFRDCDLSLLEVNPLIITSKGELLCLDAKLNIDDNALYRQPELQELFDPTQENARELEAKEADLSYIALDGNIGCMVNGAGLAMATMDLIKLSGGEPANFLDVGGSATSERVTKAFKLILGDPKVKAVFVNIFGGIVRCDLIADGIIAAVKEVGIKVPVVVRLEGNNWQEGKQALANSGLNIIASESWAGSAKAVVEAAQEG